MSLKDPRAPYNIVKTYIKEWERKSGVKLYRRSDVYPSIYSFIKSSGRITPNIAEKLTILLPDTEVIFWLNLQRDYDIEKIKEKC
jgi:plasmid maintenance system antidote protein VapI